MNKILKEDEGVVVTLEGDLVRKQVKGLNHSRLSCRVEPEEMVDREIRALNLLDHVPGIQRFVRRISFDSFYSRYMEGNSLREYTDNLDGDYFGVLLGITQQCHAAGVYRLGQNRLDFRVDPKGNPGIIDFGNVLFRDDPIAKIPGITFLARQYGIVRIYDLHRRYS